MRHASRRRNTDHAAFRRPKIARHNPRALHLHEMKLATVLVVVVAAIGCHK
jgi:hypothetical protein